MSEEKVREIFSQHGNIKSLVLFQNNIGQFGFVCYEDPEGKDKEYGPRCAEKAIRELNEYEVDGENKLYLRHALKKADRELEKKNCAIRFKKAKKRCNLYVKNIPATWTQLEVSQLFTKFGEIESIRVDKSQNGTHFAFVCFKHPDPAVSAK